MIERWAKLYANALTDEKLLAVALDSSAPRAVVSATSARLIAYAGQHAPETGSIAGFDVGVWAAWCETTTEIIERLLASARKFGLLVGEAIKNWARRQRQKIERPLSAGARRMREYRARKRTAAASPKASPGVT